MKASFVNSYTPHFPLGDDPDYSGTDTETKNKRPALLQQVTGFDPAGEPGTQEPDLKLSFLAVSSSHDGD